MMRMGLLGKPCACAGDVPLGETAASTAMMQAARSRVMLALPRRDDCQRIPGDIRNMTTRQMKLGLFIRPGGHHIACWRHPCAQADAGVNCPHFVEMAQLAERGLFAMLFSADNHTVGPVS